MWGAENDNLSSVPVIPLAACMGEAGRGPIVALKSMYPLLSLHCTKISSCGCAERLWAILKVCRVGTLT